MSFAIAFERKKFSRHYAEGKGSSRKPRVVIFNNSKIPFVRDIIDALESLNIPYVLKSANDTSSEKDLEKSDMVIFFDQNPMLYKLASQYLCVPVAPHWEQNTKDYNAVLECGNGFYFHLENKWEVFSALIRACETFQFPYDWENLLREIYSMSAS